MGIDTLVLAVGLGTAAAVAVTHGEKAVTGVRSAEPDRPMVSSMLRCSLMLFLVKISLRTRGFSRTIGWIRRRVEGVPEVAPVDIEAIKRIEYTVAMAGAFYPGRALCLEQSLVLYYLLRRRGIAVSYCQGTQPHPFQAHAWVEYRGEPINDIAEHVKRFARLPHGLP